MTEILFAVLASSTFGVLALGFFFGLRHATDADHLAAVTTIVSERKNLWSSAIVGGFWGIGHTISLLLAGIFVVLLDFEINEQTERFLEFCVGIMLFLLGLNVLRKLLKGGKIHFHTHEHGTGKHAHPHIHERDKIDRPHTHHGLNFSPRSIFIGMVHGLAGSAGMMLLYLPTIETNGLKMLYILIFGIGSIGGMMLMSLLVGLPFHLTALRFSRLNQILQGVAAFIGIFVGGLIIYEKGIAEGLFV